MLRYITLEKIANSIGDFLCLFGDLYDSQTLIFSLVLFKGSGNVIMRSRQVFVVWTYPLFYTSLRLILDDPNINLMSAASDYAAAHDQIMSLQPDTIIIEEGEEDISTEVMALLQICPSGGRVIGLNLMDNQLSVYHREHRIVGEAEDLLHLIQSD